MKTIKGILVSIVLTWSIGTYAQWIIIDTMLSYDVFQWESYHNFQLRFIDDGQIAFAYTFHPSSPSAEGEIYLRKTSNDGINWYTAFTKSGGGAVNYDFQFPDYDTGFISYNQMSHTIVERTIYGGGTWEYITGYGPTKMIFLNGMKGYGTFGSIFKRYENGTFINVDTLGYSIYNERLIFAKNNIGYRMYSLSNSEPRKYLTRTMDDGENWDLVLEMELRSFTDINVLSDSLCYISCDSGYIYKSTNFGETWTELKMNSDNYIKSLSFVNSSIGYALCSYDGLFRTDDGGISWISQSLPSNIDLYRSVRMINENVGYIYAKSTGSPGYDYYILLKTENGGFASINNKNENQNILKTYPNPFTNYLSVELNPKYSEIDICDMKGINVYSNNLQQFNNQILKIELSNLESGVYFLKIKTKDDIITKKIIKL